MFGLGSEAIQEVSAGFMEALGEGFRSEKDEFEVRIQAPHKF